MNTILIVILLLVTLAMIGCILLQRSEGGGLGASNSPMGGLMSARGHANFLTKLTGILAAIFMSLCIILAILNGRTKIVAETSIIDQISKQAEISQQKAVDVPTK